MFGKCDFKDLSSGDGSTLPSVHSLGLSCFVVRAVIVVEMEKLLQVMRRVRMSTDDWVSRREQQIGCQKVEWRSVSAN